jgi:four helix bundle protein
MRQFNFEKLEIWQLSITVGDQLFDIADALEQRKQYRFAEQLRGAGMSISNNIAEGSGSVSSKEFCQFLNYAHRSCFECANIIIILVRRALIDSHTKEQLYEQLDIVSRKITAFQRYLTNNPKP